MITDQICDFPYRRVKGDLLVLLDEGDGVATGSANEAFEDLLFFGDVERGVLVVMVPPLPMMMALWFGFSAMIVAWIT